MGSSPRMRGTLTALGEVVVHAGIIPAYAGNTEPLLLPKLRTLGSSPRMRGTHYRSVHREHGHGIIPAYAGNTSPTAAIHPTRRDHPRVCGEHRVVITVLIKHSGSSPRMRGTREASGPSMRFRGIIPAYAGNTSVVSTLSWPSRDHPRVCGEHERIANDSRFRGGSSPRMRGTLRVPEEADASGGIIPAYAGNTCTPP